MQIMQEKKMKKGRSIGKLPMRILLAVVLQLFREGIVGQWTFDFIGEHGYW
jgi:hypothetical protein